MSLKGIMMSTSENSKKTEVTLPGGSKIALGDKSQLDNDQEYQLAHGNAVAPSNGVNLNEFGKHTGDPKPAKK